MNSLLLSKMAQMESFEAASEFDIPEVSWAEYDVRDRADDIYISSLSSIFDALRMENASAQKNAFDAIAKTLLLYSRSAAAKYLSGVEVMLNQLYSSALFYLADRPATGTFLARLISDRKSFIPEEQFLYALLSRNLNSDTDLIGSLSEALAGQAQDKFYALEEKLGHSAAEGLCYDPRQFIAAVLGRQAIVRFRQTNIWASLEKHAANYSPESWDALLNNADTFPLWELLPSQAIALEAGLLKSGKETVSLQMPTSAGKTSLCELLIFQEVKLLKRKVLFLVPFRALAAEIHGGICRRLKKTGIKILAAYGGNIPTKGESASSEETDVLIVTPEKFSALMQVMPKLLVEFSTVICDEGHLIDDSGRGLQYELLLTKLRITGGAERRIIFMSAILPNVLEIHEWLGGTPEALAQSNYRPVATDHAFLEARSNGTWRLSVNPIDDRPRRFTLMNFLTADDFRYENPTTRRMNLMKARDSNLSLACATALKARRNGPVALFTTTKKGSGVAGLAEKLTSMFDLGIVASRRGPKPSENLSDLTEYLEFLFGGSFLLTRLSKSGAGFHHGDLPQEVRRVMEESIENGCINILICTTTLAEGVNLPIRTLVVHTIRRHNKETQRLEFLQNRTIKNVIGRAGRAGKETRGRVVYVSEAEHSQISEILQDNGMEPARGRLYQLIEAIRVFLIRHDIPLENEMLEGQAPWFLALLDSIDCSIVELIPENAELEAVPGMIDELLSRTLADRQSSNEDFKECLQGVFRLRAQNLTDTVPRSVWPLLKSSGSSPRFWKIAKEAGISEHPLWEGLSDPLSPEWINSVIEPTLAFPTLDLSEKSKAIVTAIREWLQGKTYIEIAQKCEMELEETLELLSSDIGYRLQEHLAKLCQLAIAYFGEEKISETAQVWPSLLQFGLGTAQQLDLVEFGASDRLSLWSIQRYLDQTDNIDRGRKLIRGIRANSEAVKSFIEQDKRVPRICSRRFLDELGIE